MSLTAAVEILTARLNQLASAVKFDEKQKQLSQLSQKTQADDFWQNQEQAAKLMKQLTDLKTEVEEIKTVKEKLVNLNELIKGAAGNELQVLAPEIEQFDQ